MPISSQVPIIGYVANGVTKSFAFPFAILSADDLKVKVGADVVTTGFSIAGVGDRDGGSVTFTDAPASLTPIILYREVTLDRTTDYQENGDLLAIVLDDDLDRIWMALQDQLLRSDRALRSPLGETLQQLPPASERALMALAFDAAGNPIVVRGTNDGGAALALDLMDTAPGKGAALVGYGDGTVADALDALAGASSSAIDIRTYGAVLDGVTNDAAALLAANAAAVAAKLPLLIPGVAHIGTATTITAPLADSMFQMFSAGSTVTISNGLPVRPEWFGNNMAKALAAIPASGGTLLLSNVVYPPFGIPVRRNNISIIGTKLPKFKADFTGLEGGSIIQGPFDFRGDDITLEGFGVDSGSAVCAALYGGTAQEGFLSGLPVATRSKRLHASRLVSICKEPTALVHGFALEGYTNSEIHQIEAVYGVHGIAIKATDSNVSNLKARGCAYDGVIIKSDTAETTSERLNVNGIVCGSIGTYDGAGLRITNSTGNQVLVGVNIKNVVCNRTVYGIDFDCNDSHLIDSVNIDGAFFFVCQTYGFRNMGMARRCKVSNAVAYNCGAQGFLTSKAVGAGSGDTQPEIDFDNCTASHCSTGFELYGRNKVSNCWSNFNTYFGFYAAPGSRVSRIACVAASNGTAAYGPDGSIWYPGNSAPEAKAATLQNGWQNYGVGKEIASFYITDDGIVRLSGLIKLGTVGSTIFQLPVGYRPKNELWFLCSGLNGATLTPAHVVVGADGTVVAQAGAGNAFLSLDGISFRMDLT